MDGKNQLQTSFEQEFNRLTFLASIAAGSTLSDEHSVDLKSSSKSAQIVVSSPHCEMRSVNNPPIPDGSLLNNLNGIHMTIKRPADNTLNNDIVRSVIDDSKTNVNDSGKVNDFFMSPNVLHVASNSSNNTSENTNTIGIQKAYSSVVQPSSNNPRNILPNSPINQSPLMGNNILVTNSFLQQSTSLSGFVQSDGNSHINTHSQQSKLQNSVFNNASPVTTQAASITQQLNPPLVISQASPSNAEKILSQSPVSCSTGQTILLPANFAGMSGRVLILNNPGKPPQAIAITPSSANIQQLQATNLQFQPTVSVSSELSSGLVTSKPVLLLPNNVISKVEQQPSTSLQQPHLVNNALHMVASQNPQLRVQQSTLSNKQMPQLQQVQPVSLSSFQSIRPKSFLPNIRNVQPKSNNQGISRFSINSATANQGLRLSHFSNQSPNSPKQPTIISAKVSGTPVSEKNSISSISVIATSPESSSVLSNTSLLNNFDKTMTQHLLTLEKTDPHLFQHRGKMPITQFQKSEDNPNMQLDQANKLKSLLQSTPTTSLSNSFELSQKQQRSFVVHQTSPQSVKTVSLTQGSISTTSVKGNQSALKSVPNISTGLPNQAVTSTSSAILATQMMPQRQHASLQNILKLQQQQQQSKTVVNKSQHLKQHSQEHLQIQQQQQQQLQQQQLQQQQQSILQQARQLQLQHQQLQQHRYIQKKQQLQQHSLQPQTNQQQTQLLQQQQLQQLQQLMCKGSPMSSTSGSDVSMMEKKLIGQVKDLQESSNHNKRENAPTSISIQPNILKGSQKNLFTLKQDSSAINPSPPLKLLSSLTNMVNSSTSLSTSASDSITNPQKSISMNAPLTAGLTDQQNIQPVLFQLTGGGNILSTHMLNTTRLTPAQLIELQKTLSLQQNKQLNAIRAVITQPQSKVTSSIVSSVNQTQNLASCLASKNALQNFVMVSNSEQSKPAVTSSSNKNVQLSQQVQQLLQKNQVLSQGIKSNGGVGKVPDNLVVNKVLQEQLKHMTLAQREQLMRQYMPGKMSAASVENVTAPMLLASILKNKQVFPMPSVIPAKPSLNSQPSKKLTSKIVSRGLKRTNEIIKKEPEDHPLVKKWKGVLYEDHVRYQNPDYKSPFASVNDAMKRILPYHVSQDVENQNNEKDKFEEHFELFASNFQDRCSAIFERLNHLLFKDSQVISPLPDEIMIGRLFISEEQERFMHQKTAISEGRAFVVRNEEKGELECVEVAVVENANTDSSTNAISLNLSEENQLDNRLRIAHKDIRNIDLNDSDIDEEDTETFDGENEDNVYPVDNIDDDYEEEMGTGEIMDEEEIETEDIYTEENEEEIENEELNEFSDHISTYREDSELAAATTNLLADLQQDDDYNLDFDL